MIEFDEIRLEIAGLTSRIQELAVSLELEEKKRKLVELEDASTKPEFWNDGENSKAVLKDIGIIKESIEGYEKLAADHEDVLAMIELAEEEGDSSLLGEITTMAEGVKLSLEKQVLSTLLNGEYDSNNAIISFHAGAGGTEAQDWAEMLYRMFTRWAERHSFKTQVLDYLDGEEAGLKSASILIQGFNAYGFLKSEHGVHRLVRISPFDSSGRRHTSFASVEVVPEITDDANIEIRSEDLRIDVYRASGAGGQHVNKTSSAVRITHIPTGVVCSCQTQRSQTQNRDFAMRMLKSKLVEIKERAHLDKISDIKGEQLQIAWGAQIRSYVFMPYTLAKDHRTGYENGNIQGVMDGDLDGFMNEYLKALNLGKL